MDTHDTRFDPRKRWSLTLNKPILPKIKEMILWSTMTQPLALPERAAFYEDSHILTQESALAKHNAWVAGELVTSQMIAVGRITPTQRKKIFSRVGNSDATTIGSSSQPPILGELNSSATRS